MKQLIILGCGILAYCSCFAIDPCVKGDGGELSIAADGSIVFKAADKNRIVASGGGDFWAIEVETATQPALRENPLVILQAEQQARVEALDSKGGFQLVYDRLKRGSQVWNIAITFTFKAVGDGFEIGGEVVNNAKGWRVTKLHGPAIKGLSVTQPKYAILLPQGFGVRINRAPTPKATGRWRTKGDFWEVTHEWAYPSCLGSMQWMAYAGDNDGFYYGSHDTQHRNKNFIARYYPTTGTYGATTENRFFVECGQTRALPPVVLASYAGDWHAAAKRYRAWYDTCHSVKQGFDWMTENTGWLLVILKQQNEEVMWRYEDLPELADLAKARGLDTLGIFGWTIGGHDHLYPMDLPDPKMGGVEGLKKGLAACRAKGVKTILYANGQLQQKGTEFWNKVGNKIAVEKRDGNHYFETYHKYRDIPCYIFELGCQHTEEWFQQMLHLAKQAHSLGADGMIFDQLAITRPMACYALGHGHDEGPVMTYEQDRARLIGRLAKAMREFSPTFAFVTEGFNDSNLADVVFFHACQTGSFQVTNGEMLSRLKHSGVYEIFPELFRYTHPSVITTVRVPTPASNRAMVNYTALYGLRTDIESRYMPDVTYLRKGTIPQPKDYGTVNFPPDFGVLTSAPADELTGYMSAVNAFSHKHADVLYRGKFVDHEGCKLESEKPVAYACYQTQNGGYGVMVWNPNGEAVACKVVATGKQLKMIDEPNAKQPLNVDSKIPQYSLRLYRFE